MITAYIDGGARGNPGPAGFGVQIQDDRLSNLGMDEAAAALRQV